MQRGCLLLYHRLILVDDGERHDPVRRSTTSTCPITCQPGKPLPTQSQPKKQLIRCSALLFVPELSTHVTHTFRNNSNNTSKFLRTPPSFKDIIYQPTVFDPLSWDIRLPYFSTVTYTIITTTLIWYTFAPIHLVRVRLANVFELHSASIRCLFL